MPTSAEASNAVAVEPGEPREPGELGEPCEPGMGKGLGTAPVEAQAVVVAAMASVPKTTGSRTLNTPMGIGATSRLMQGR